MAPTFNLEWKSVSLTEETANYGRLTPAEHAGYGCLFRIHVKTQYGNTLWAIRDHAGDGAEGILIGAESLAAAKKMVIAALTVLYEVDFAKI